MRAAPSPSKTILDAFSQLHEMLQLWVNYASQELLALPLLSVIKVVSLLWRELTPAGPTVADVFPCPIRHR